MKRVLIVDDEVDLRDMVREELVAQGYLVQTAKSGSEALDLLNSEPRFDFIITDMRMPNGGGEFFLANVPDGKQASKVIVVSGYTDVSDDELKRLGVSEILTKPLSLPKLMKLLKS